MTDPAQVYNVSYTVGEIGPLCQKWYGQLTGGLPEEQALRPIRVMPQRVAASLNHLNWQLLTRATDDFLVLPADASHTFMDDYGEMLASVPAVRIELLRSRGLLGRKAWWTLGAVDEDQES